MKIARSSTMAWLMTQCIALLVTVPILHVRAAEGAAGEQKVRPAAVAGAFYPADPQELSKMIDDMLAKATPPPVDGTIIAAVAPHAGYPYSGPVAAWTYAAIGAQVKAGHKYTRVVVIAPSHYVGFDFTSVYDGDAYTTPLGQIPVDKEFARWLAKMSPTILLSDKGHQATADAPEHSVEVELPWLQKILGNFELVPIVMGNQSYESSRALGVALAKMLRNDHDTLVLASSDLSHYHPYADAESIDHKTLHALETYDYYSMSRNFQYRGQGEPGIWEACGGAPIVAAMIYAERLGANKAEVLKYANSGDITGDKSRVVGYSADLFVKSTQATDATPLFSLTDPDKAELLALARKSVEYMILKQGTLRAASAGERNAKSRVRRLHHTHRGRIAARLHRLHLAHQAALHDGARHGYAGCAARSALCAGSSRGAAQACLRDLRAFAAAPCDRCGADQGGPRRAHHEERRLRGLAAAAGSRGAELGPGNISEPDLRQSRHESELLEGRRHRHLQLYGGSVQREEQGLGIRD